VLVNWESLVNGNNPDIKALYANLGGMTSRGKKSGFLALGKGTLTTSKVTIYHPWPSDLDSQLYKGLPQPPVAHTTPLVNFWEDYRLVVKDHDSRI
jgi:hypothetical protein